MPLLPGMTSDDNGIYITHFLYTYILTRFTLLQCKGEIGHQHI